MTMISITLSQNDRIQFSIQTISCKFEVHKYTWEKICTYKSENISDGIKPNSNKMIVVYLFLGLLALALANTGNEGFFSNLKDWKFNVKNIF